MRIRRGLLFWGLFFIPLGAVPLLVRAGVLRTDQIGEVWRLWPILLIGIGIAILLGRSRASVAVTVVAAVLFGTFAGAVIAAGPGWIGGLSNCAFQDGVASSQLSRDGTFSEPASIRMTLRCGSATLRPGTAAGWRVDAVYRGAPPVIDSGSGRLELRTPGGQTRQDWTVEVPAGTIGRVDLTADAAATNIDLTGVHASALAATVNAGDFKIDAGSGAVDRINVSMNAGRLRLNLGPTATEGGLSANAGAMELCVAESSALRLNVVEQLTFGTNLANRGLVKGSDGVWTRAGSGPMVSLRIEGNAASLTLNPEGGCR